MIAILMVALIFLVPIDHYSWKGRTASSSLYDDSNETSLSRVLLDDSYDEKPLYYTDQTVDHFDSNDGRTYSQRYYKKSKHFGGPGHPILLIMGGESALEPPMLYPYVHEGLASTFGAFVVSPEHRFYGNSQPVGDETPPSVPEMMATLTPDQALEDAIGLIQAVREVLDCHPDRSHPDYCPVITFGGSYPGFLSAMMRFLYPNVVDGSYASSAPLELYSQAVDSDAYFDKITQVAEAASEGCSEAVRSTLFDLRETLFASFGDDNGQSGRENALGAAEAVGFCPSSLPPYIDSVGVFVSETIQYLVPAIFADFNMAYYPPGPDRALSRACAIFQKAAVSPNDKIRSFFELRHEIEHSRASRGDDKTTANEEDFCFDLNNELPEGSNARIRGSDNSGSGSGSEGRIWEFQCCKDLIVKAGYSEESMFLPRPFSYEWHEDHCQTRFPGITVDPHRMNNEWDFSNLTKTSRIVFANGLNDGWSTSSITNATSVSDAMGYHELFVVNFPNGAHHSELNRLYPNPRDTDDIVEGYQTGTEILAGWLDEIVALQQ